MASQRITVAKVGGRASKVVVGQLSKWARARSTDVRDEWSSDQWPVTIRIQVDTFADRLRAAGYALPVIYFVEWSDLWSMGDLFPRWLTPDGGPGPIIAHGDRFEIFGYPVPDGDRLRRHLSQAGQQQFPEYDDNVNRLQRALETRENLTDQAVILVLREVFGGLVTDEELAESIARIPTWLMDF